MKILANLADIVNVLSPDNVVAEWYDDPKNGTGVSAYQDGEHLVTVYLFDRHHLSDGQDQVFDIIQAVRFILSKVQ
jgi:hypothetical protein